MKIKELFEECRIYSAMVIFILRLYVINAYWFIVACYYRLFGIKYVMIKDKFTKYPRRLDK